jgi:glycerol-3-phosphate dehydrogenase
VTATPAVRGGNPNLDGAYFEVAIVGGGINGASAAQHLAAAGFKVLVVEQSDFANGATARSSRLLHCGLRHLASGSNSFAGRRASRLLQALVAARHDMLARDELVAAIPARLRRIDFCLPIYTDDAYSPWQMDAAFAVLRALSPRGVALDYRRYAPGRMHQVPIAAWLREPQNLRTVAVFSEYLFDWPERITLDALFDARRMGAELCNYTRVEQLRRADSGGHWQLRLQTPEGEAEVSARIVLNLAGAWVDDLVARAGAQIPPRCNGIKGVHVALRLPAEFSGWGLFAYNSLGEPLYCLPMHDFHYAGLTRRPYRDTPGEVAANDDEIDWMIAELNRCLPRLELTRADILYSWAGINPLTYDPAQPLGSREIRLHDLAGDGLPGMLALTGGPIMTHRRIARQLVTAVAKRLSPSGEKRTAALSAIVTGNKLATHEANARHIDLDEARRCAREEMPRDLADLLLRRLGIGWNADQGLASAGPVAEAVAAEFGWSPEDIDSEIDAYARYLQTARRRPGT